MLPKKGIKGGPDSGLLRAGLFAALSLLVASALVRAATSSEVELRARVEQLYSALQRSDWRQVEKYLTKESKPIYRSQRKKAVAGYQIESIKLEASGDSAEVVVRLPPSSGSGARPFFVPETTHWRQIKGRWYLQLRDPHAMPSPSSAAAQKQASSPPPSLHSRDLKFQSTWASLGYVHQGEVKVARFAFSNVSQRAVTLGDVQTDCACLRMKSQQKEFKPGEAGVLEFELDPSSLSFNVKRALTLTVGLETEPEHALTQLTIAAVLTPDSPQPPAP